MVYLLSLIPFIQFSLKLKPIHFLLISIALIIIDLLITFRSINSRFILFSFACLFFSSITSLYWFGSIKIMTYPIAMLIGLYLTLVLSVDEYFNLINFLSFCSYVLVIGALIGFIYSMFGGKPLFIILNPDGRKNYFFLTTFSNAIIGKFIRPSGVFDEPGALSFFLCIVAIIRIISGKRQSGTWFIMIGGLVTISLAHILFFCTLLPIINFKKKKTLVIIVSVVTLLIILFSFSEVGKSIFSLISGRLSLNKTNSFISNNSRTSIIENCLYIFRNDYSLKKFVFSLNPGYMDSKYTIYQNYGKLGENPFSPLLYYGLLIAWPYYFLLIYLLILSIKKRDNIVFLGLALLLLQRPNITNIGYAFLIFMPISLYKKIKKDNICCQ